MTFNELKEGNRKDKDNRSEVSMEAIFLLPWLNVAVVLMISFFCRC